MCGITGLVAWWQSPTRNQVVVTAMTDTMHHRGPDGHGIWSTDNVCLGHTRLAVIDIAAGTQPMVVRRPGGGEVAIVFCGELYGYQRLRRQLQAAGQVFTTASDTEVVLRAFLQWGERFVDRLTGMYAIAIWDADAETLLLVRDRVGIKPLYVAQTATELLFGSEIKALLAHPGVSAEVDAEGLGQLLAMVPMTSPGNAVLAGVEELPPGTLLRYDRSGVHQRRYWQLGTSPHQHDRLTTVDHVRDLLQQSVREHVVADVPIGALCSGGVDSSAITALAAAALDDPGLLASFDIEHHGAAVASSSFHRGHDHPFAVAAAGHIGSDHHTVRVSTDDLLAAHDRTLHAMDLPSLSAINVSLAVLFAEVGVKRKVVLSGEGADELFRGYAFHEPPSRHPSSAGMPWAGAYQPLTHLLRRDVIGQVRPGRYIDQQRRQLLDQLPIPDGEPSRVRRLREVMWLTWSLYLPFLLRRTDRLSMAAGVEARVPFLDHRLVEYLWAVPPQWHRDNAIEKTILRQAVSGLLPEQIVWRPKSGYPASMTADYQTALWRRARDLIATPSSPVLQLVSARTLEAYLALHDGDLSDWTAVQHVAYVLELDAWLRINQVRIR
ncbi:asparagine synthase (glutamine-hydrolyzing) [Catellatospora methionotrophica]|uniref:asparagine synthase (glutamine-hydrolyzing) n=1 Tax=Catellatospora methionotrophica TaxID=121620 RepID=UPI0033CC2DCD